MADYSDPKRATAYRFTLSLFARSDNQIKTAPTLAAGDVKVSKDNGATANITTLPTETPASSGILQVDLSATEMTADLVTVIFRDASGAEWNDVAVHIAPSPVQMGDLATAANLATVDTVVDAILVDTAEIGAAGAGLTALASQTSVNTIDDFLDTEVAAILAAVDTEVAAIKAKTDNLPASPAATGDIPSAATIADAVWDEDATGHQTQGTFGQAIGDPAADTDSIWALVNTNLDATVSSRASQTSVNTVDDFLDTEIAAIKAKTDLIPASPAAVGDIPTAAAVADAVWDEAIAGHAGAGSTGEALSNASSAGDPWGTSLPGAYAAGTAGYIVGTNLDGTVSSRASQTSVNTIDDFLDTEIATIITNIATVDTVVDAILVDTAEIGVAGAGLTALASQSSVNTIDDFLDTEIAAIKVKTDQLNFSASSFVMADVQYFEGSTDVAGGIRTALGLASANLDTQIGTLATASALATVDTVVDAILVDTDTTIPATLTTIAGYIDTEVASILAAVDTEVAAIKAKTDNLPTDPADASDIAARFTTLDASVAALPDANANADALLDRADGVETGFTMRQTIRLMAAVMLGKLSGAGTATEVFRDLGDTKDRISATVDASGNRTAITRDAT